MMGTEKIRLGFLTWWWHDDQRELRQSCAQGWALHVWISSRADIEVELPSLRAITMGRRENEHDSGFNTGVELCIDAIEVLGLKVKP